MKNYIYILILFSGIGLLTAQDWESFFETETLSVPNQRWVPSSMAVHGTKQIAVATHRGEVWVGDYQEGFKALKWQPFATGLRLPHNIESSKTGITVRQGESQWTLLKDENKDGIADLYWDQTAPETAAPTSSPFKGMIWLTAKQNPPFKDQYFGYSHGDQHISRMIKAETDKGDCYSKLVLQDGFRYTIDELIELPDHTYILTQTNQTDLSRTRLRAVVQRLTWKTPLASFEIEKVTANASFFTITFTEPLNPETAEKDWSYNIKAVGEQKPEVIDKLNINPSNPNEVFVYLKQPIVPDKFYELSCDAIWSTNQNPVRNPKALFIWKPVITAR